MANFFDIFRITKDGEVTLLQKVEDCYYKIRQVLQSVTNRYCKVRQVVQKIENEELNGLTGCYARPDIRAGEVWRQGQNPFFDIRLTNAACSQKDLPVCTILKKHENEKKRSYNSRIINVEHGTFTALVFSLTGGKGPETSMFHKHIAHKTPNKTEERHEKIQTLIRCKLSFLILRPVLLCIRGSRSISKDSVS